MKGQLTEVEGKFHIHYFIENQFSFLGENERLQVILKQKESEINDIKKVMIKFKIRIYRIEKYVIRLRRHYKKNENVYRI